MPNAKRKNDPKAKDIKPVFNLFHDPNHQHNFADNQQQFDILQGVEKEKKLNPKKIFEGYTDKQGSRGKQSNKKEVNTKNPNRNATMKPAQQRGKYKKKKKGEV